MATSQETPVDTTTIMDQSSPSLPLIITTPAKEKDDDLARLQSSPTSAIFENGISAELEEQRTQEGHAHFHRLGWKRLTVVLIVEAVALGSLGLPAAFANLGMIAGVLMTIGVGIAAMYASYIIGQVKLKFPDIEHYADIGRLLLGDVGAKFFNVIFCAQLILIVGSHVLTGTIAFKTLSESNVCSIAWAVLSGVLLLALAIPPSFAEVAILGYIDFASIVLAIGVTMVATGSSSTGPTAVAATWSAWPKEGLPFSQAFISVNTIVFAYAFAACQPSFMDEMHTPRDYMKSVVALGIFEISIYTLTGAIIYAFVGQEVQSPALLSAGPLMSKVVFGIALPVIFISGSINTTVVGRFVHGRVYRDSVVRYVNTRKGWVTWIAIISAITFASWVVAEAIPFFPELLSICSSLFISGFSFYFPAAMWYMLLKDGYWYSKHNLRTAILNLVVFIIGITILVGGTVASIVGLVSEKTFCRLLIIANFPFRRFTSSVMVT